MNPRNFVLRRTSENHLNGADFNYADLSSTNLAGTEMQGANLSYTCLINANLMTVFPP
jgi:uncharacterized protein YjbI with pentapeptide repeats